VVDAALSHTTKQWLDKIGAWSLVASFIAALMRIVFRTNADREQAIATGDSSRELTLRGWRPAKSDRLFWATPILKSPAGAQALDKITRVVAWGGLVVFVVAVVVTLTLQLA
jgi:hypothetical protein